MLGLIRHTWQCRPAKAGTRESAARMRAVTTAAPRQTKRLTTTPLTLLPRCCGDCPPNASAMPNSSTLKEGQQCLCYCLLFFFSFCLPRFRRRTALFKVQGMSSTLWNVCLSKHKTKKKKKKLEYCKKVAQLTNRHCNKHTLQTLKQAFFSPPSLPF